MKIYKSLMLLGLAMLLWINAEAQHALIQVFDKETKAPIPYANLCFEGLENGVKTYKITSLKGLTENNINEESILVISFLAYQTLVDTIKAGQGKNYELEPDLFNLNQVVVTATRTEKTLKDVPVITQVVLASEIASRGITDISTVLEDDVPGIEFHQSGFGSDIKMQGLDATYVLFLINGERMAGETEGNIDYSRLNMNDVERIEIVKGASSALYGSQAMGGVVNIITKEPRDKIEFSFGTKYRQFNQINFKDVKASDDFYLFKTNLDKPNLNLHATLGFNWNNFSAKTNFVRKSTDAYELVSRDTMVLDIIEYDTILKKLSSTTVPGSQDFTVSQMLKYQFGNKLKIKANASYYIHDQYDFKKDNKFDQYEDYNWGAKGFYKYSKEGNLEFSYQDDIYNKFEHSEKSDIRKQVYSHHFFNPKVIINQAIFENHQITGGLEYLAENLSTRMFSGLSDSLVAKTGATAIAYFQDDYKINSKLSIIGGLRFDYHTAFGANLSPKLSFMYKWIPLTFRANYARGFRTPTLKELYMNWDHLGIFYIRGNEDMLPETNDYISASVEYTKNKLNGSVNVYKNWFRNRIGGFWSIAEDGKQVYNYSNIGKSDITGVEILLKYKFNKYFFLSGGYSYVNDHQTLDDINISAIAPHSGNIRVQYALTKRVYNLKVNLSGRITGAKNYYEATDIEINGEQEVGTYAAQYSAFSLWKLTISQSFHNGINIVLGIDNIFDYRAPIINFNTSLSPGRRYFISANFSLDKLYREFTTIKRK